MEVDDSERPGTLEEDPIERHTLRRTTLIFNDINDDASGNGSEDGGEEGGEGEEGEEGEEGPQATPVTWSVPDGFKVADEPEVLDKSLIGQKVYMRWEKYGWQLGKITDVVTQKTPQLFKKFNFRVIWSDGGKGPVKLDAASYACGPDARFNSWVVLEEV